MVLYDNTAQSANVDINDVTLKFMQLYKLTFWGIGKAFSPKIDQIKTNSGNKTVIMWATKSKLGLMTNLFVIPLQNPIPIAALLGGSAILAALGLTLLILSKVEKIFNVLIPCFLLPLLIFYHKDISRFLRKGLK